MKRSCSDLADDLMDGCPWASKEFDRRRVTTDSFGMAGLNSILPSLLIPAVLLSLEDEWALLAMTEERGAELSAGPTVVRGLPRSSRYLERAETAQGYRDNVGGLSYQILATVLPQDRRFAAGLYQLRCSGCQ